MSTEKAITTVPKSNEVTFVPFGGDDEIKLSVIIIQKFVAIPTKTGKIPDERESIRFMMLCRSRKLNPFEGDCFLMGYEARDGSVNWSLITAHQAFLKRAEVNPEFDGFDSGVIVREGENETIIEREGDFLYPGDELLGGWCIVHFKNRKHPMKRRLNLNTFKKPYGRWLDDPAGMIVKCAEADGLRSAFPTMLGGLYTDNERPVIEVSSVPAKAPEFDARTTPPARIAESTIVQTPTPPRAQEQKEVVQTPPASQTPAPQPVAAASDQKSQPPATQKEPDPAPAGGPPAETGATPPPASVPAVNTSETEALQSLRLLMAKSGVTEEQVMVYCRANNIAKADQKKLGMLSDAKLLTLGKGWHNILPKIRG